MTELQRARDHLLRKQQKLEIARKHFGIYRSIGVMFDFDRAEAIGPYEDAVLAALSWAWEEQQKVNPRGGWPMVGEPVIISEGSGATYREYVARRVR